MEEKVTRQDLRQLRLELISDFEIILTRLINPEKQQPNDPEWIKGNKVRKILDNSPGTLQNLRIEGKVRFKKLRGTYYYNRADLMNLFKDK